MAIKQLVQELKPGGALKEMLFEDVMDEPVWLKLKAEGVQPAPVAAGQEERSSSSFYLLVSQKQPLTIELFAPRAIIKLHGTMGDNTAAGSGSPTGAGQPQAA